MKKLTLSDIVKTRLNIKKNCSYTLKDLLDTEYYVIDYDVRLSNFQPVQRDFCWTTHQKEQLILSLLKDIKLPSFAILMSRKENIRHVKIIDGKQRLSTIFAFMNNEFSISINENLYVYDDFDQECQMKIWNCTLNFDIVYEYEDSTLTDLQLIHWFELVNFSGTMQDTKHLDNLKMSLLNQS